MYYFLFAATSFIKLNVVLATTSNLLSLGAIGDTWGITWELK